MRKMRIKNILIDYGYKVIKRYMTINPENNTKVYYVTKNNKEYFAKYFKCNKRSWESLKQIYSDISNLNLSPSIEQIINLDDGTGIIINDKVGESYYKHIRNSSLKTIVEKYVKELHNNGYLHGDLHSFNILIYEGNKVMFIDLDDCYYMDITHYNNVYKINNFEEARQYELDNIDFIPL